MYVYTPYLTDEDREQGFVTLQFMERLSPGLIAADTNVFDLCGQCGHYYSHEGGVSQHECRRDRLSAVDRLLKVVLRAYWVFILCLEKENEA